METFLERLLYGLATRGVKITLATSRKPDMSWLAETGIQWMYVPAWRGPTLGAFVHLVFHTLRCWLFAVRDARIFFRHLPDMDWKTRLSTWYSLIPFAGRRWDAIYFPWNSAAIHYLPLFDLGMPVVLSCRGSQINVAPHNENRRSFLSGLEKTLKRATLVHCVSDDILQQAVSLGLNPDKTMIIHPAVDANFFMPSSAKRSDNGVFQVVMTGSLIWVKGYEYALIAIRQLVDMAVPVQCVIIGNGQEHSRILFTIKDLGISNHVQLLGKRSPEQVREILQNSDVFLLSSLSEGISNAVLEAMACGLPIVTTNCGGMREAVTDGVEGFVSPVRDPKAMTLALLDLWQQPKLRQKMGKAGRQRVLGNFQLESQIQDFFKVFGEITF
jgi:glycosyltransferase involved in cell wall biosynthesis